MQGREGRAEAWEAKFPERDASVPRRKASQLASPEHKRSLVREGFAEPRAGRPHVEPTDVYSCPPQEGGYSPSEAPKADPKRTANSERRTRAPRRTPCPRSGDAGRGWKTIASGLAHRSAQHLTPLRGRPLRNEEAMEREGAKVLVQGPTL